MKNNTLIPLAIVPEYYKNLTEKQKKEICNGCGPEKLGWFIPDTLLGLDCTEACNIHDVMYAFGESEKDRKYADDVFLANVKSLVVQDTSFLGVLLKPLRLLLISRAYKILRKAGAIFFDSEVL